MILFATDRADRLPTSELARRGQMLDRMALNIEDDENPGRSKLDGIGQLFRFGSYCDSSKCLFCPSHRNGHTYESNAAGIERATSSNFSSYEGMLFSNYQYVATDQTTNLHKLDDRRIIISDGFRTKRDFNHRIGMNTVRGDCSIQWWNDNENQFHSRLPDTPMDATPLQAEIFEQVWSLVGEEDGNQSANNGG